MSLSSDERDLFWERERERERDPKMLKNVVFRVLEFPGKKICKKTLSRVVGLRDDLSLSLQNSFVTNTPPPPPPPPPSNTTTTTTHRKVVLSRKKKKKKRERALRFPSCGLFLSSSCFVLWPVLYASNSFLVRRIEWPSAAPRRLRTTTKTTKTRTEGRRRRVGK